MYPQEQLDEWNSHKVTYNGVEYSDREALDIQRNKERGIRATKRELVALDEGMKSSRDEALKKELSEEFSKKSLRLQKQEASLNDFLEQTELKKDYSRTQTKEFDRSIAGKAKAASKKETERLHYIQHIKPNLPKVQKADNTILQKKLDFDIIINDKHKQGVIPAKVELFDVNVIAGYGSSTEIRVAKKLAEGYGGDYWKWQKKAGTCTSKYRKYEIHWYEYAGKQYDTKLKGFKER